MSEQIGIAHIVEYPKWSHDEINIMRYPKWPGWPNGPSGPATPPGGYYSNMGWSCPKCGASYSPSVQQCFSCNGGNRSLEVYCDAGPTGGAQA